MKKNKGFTLIELLAVILILGIIALIAIPTVNNIIKESKRGAFGTSSNNIVGAIEDACQLQEIKGETITTEYTFTNGSVSPSLNVKGNLPTSGTATVDTSCNVTLSITNGTYTATKTSTEDSITIVEGGEIEETPTIYTVYANGTAVYFNPVTGATCTSGEAVSTTGTKTGCMKWYTFNDGGNSSDTINLILDHNTTAYVAWNSTGSNVSGPTNLLTKLQTDTSAWSGVPTRTDSYSVSNGTATYTINYSSYKARLITAAEIATITGNTSFNESTATTSNWFYLDSHNQTQTVNTPGASSYSWLFDYTNGCTSYGCNISSTSTYGYWIPTAVADITSCAFRLISNGRLEYLAVDYASDVGVRPVITVLKLEL